MRSAGTARRTSATGSGSRRAPSRGRGDAMEFEVLASGYGLVEGPNEDAAGAILFSDVLGGGVYRVDAAGAVTTVVPKRRGVGGIALDAGGGVGCSRQDIVPGCAGRTRALCAIPRLPGW